LLYAQLQAAESAVMVNGSLPRTPARFGTTQDKARSIVFSLRRVFVVPPKKRAAGN